jgi:hypothetical protein
MFDVAYDVAPVNVCACVGHKKDGEEFNWCQIVNKNMAI